jgi:hypothetical protein
MRTWPTPQANLFADHHFNDQAEQGLQIGNQYLA